MGFFDFSKKKKKGDIILFSPFEGTIVSLDNVPDEAISKRMIGDGIAVLPSKYIVKNIFERPINIFHTGHAFSYELDGHEIIVHIGIETVSLKGEGFSILVENEKVYPIGEDVIKINENIIKGHNLSLISPVLVVTMDNIETLEMLAKEGDVVTFGDPLLKLCIK